MPAGSVRSAGLLALARSGAALAAATLAANVLGYVLLLVLSRVLVAADYGAVGALLNLAIVGAVPALAVQLVAARETARAHRRHDVPGPAVARTSMLGRLGLGAGALVGVAVVLASPLLASFLHLNGPWPAVALGTSLLPAGGTSAALGVLQGGERFGRLAVLFVAVAVTRCLAGAGAAVAGWGVTGVMVGTLAAAVAGLAVAVALVPRAFVPARIAPGVAAPVGHRSAGGRAQDAAVRARLRRDTLASTLSTGGLLAFVNLDVLLARHYLPAAASGVYAVGSLFTKVTFWGPAFLATLLYPRMVGARGRDRAVAAAAGLTAALGAVVVLFALAAGGRLVTLAAGSRYADLGRTAALFAALGTAFAVVQVLIYARVAVGDRRLGIAAWLLAAGTAGVVAATSPSAVTSLVSIALAGACCLVAVGFSLERGALRALVTSPGRYRRRQADATPASR